jgi:GTP cyclohydrolase II
MGTARKVPGGFSISGHWSFASGIMHSEWALLPVQSDGVQLPCLVPVAVLELLEVWHTDGLRGQIIFPHRTFGQVAQANPSAAEEGRFN